MSVTTYHNPRCSKSQAKLALLKKIMQKRQLSNALLFPIC